MPSVEELKETLKSKFNYDGRQLKNKSLEELSSILQKEELEVANTKEIDFGSLNEIDDTPDVYEEIKEAVSVAPPNPGDADWHEYIMRQFFPNEVTEGHPNVEGLRRVAQLKIGTITENICFLEQTPNPDNHYRATACCKMTVVTHDGMQTLVYQDVADASNSNTPKPFNLHLSSTASSRAESRVLRKVLHLNKIISAEEVVPEGAIPDSVVEESFSGPQFITDQQITLIDLLTERLNINAVKYLNSGQKQYNNIRDIPRRTAAEAIEHLHNYEKNKSPMPSAIIGYNQDWKN